MKKFDIVWRAKRGGAVRFCDINIPALDVEAAIVALRAKHGPMVQEIISVTEYVPRIVTATVALPASMPAWGTYGT